MTDMKRPKDRYSRHSFNPPTGEYEREWIRYADGTYEPVRRNGSLSKKWNDQRTDFRWWTERKPAHWLPQDDDFRFSWNHDLGEENKPADWGDKPPQEIELGSYPYFMLINMGEDGRIIDRTETIDGRRERWEYAYDEAGRLTGCLGDTGWSQDFEYDAEGRRLRDYEVGREPLMREFAYGEDNRLLSAGEATYEHDENGFRTAMTTPQGVTRYAYSPDYRLLEADLPDGRKVRYAHGQAGNRRLKFVNGVRDEEYLWRDFIRLAEFDDTANHWVFHYDSKGRLPDRATINGRDYQFKYDHVGSLKAVVDDTGNVVKAIQYGPFGEILWDTAPNLRVPLGYAGGLYDPDTGFVRFGWRDYDPCTGRWTALDPMGDAGGDDDWYGYCLDDPVNLVDPLGLFFGLGLAVAAVAAVAGFGAAATAAGTESTGEDGDDGKNGDGGWVKDLQDWAQRFDFKTLLSG